MSDARERILGRVRSSLRRIGAQPVPPPPEVRLRIPAIEDRVGRFCTALETLAGKTVVVHSKAEAGSYVRSATAGRPAISADSFLLRECGIDCDPIAADKAQVGITSAEYALADTGTLVVMSVAEPRLASLLPPVHIAVIESARILSGLDELLTRVPLPADLGASMVLITGPSRTADIEQILVRGVHGPGELHVVVID